MDAGAGVARSDAAGSVLAGAACEGVWVSFIPDFPEAEECFLAWECVELAPDCTRCFLEEAWVLAVDVFWFDA